MRQVLLMALAGVLIVLAGCKTAQVYHVGHSTIPDSVLKHPGIYYALPKTVIDVEVTETYKERRINVPKQCIDKVKKLYPLPTNGVKTIDQSVTVLRKSIPDPDALFLVDPNSSIMKQSGITFSYSESGTLDSITATMQDKTFETVTKVAGTIASAVLRAELSGVECLFYEDAAKNLKEITARKKEMLTSFSMASPTGRTAYDLEQYKLTLEKLEAEETKLKKELYEEKTGTRKVYGELIPPDTTAASGSYFSQNFGSYRAEWNATEPEHIARTLEGYFKNSEDRGFYYRVPVMGKLKVYAESKEQQERTLLWQGDVPVAQQGALLALPADYPASEVTQTITFYPDTGALKTLDIQTKAVKSEDIASALSMVNEAIAAAKAKDAAQELADDDLTKLTRQRDLLKLQSEIKGYQEE
ncbi:MAG: DUF4831 family protein [Desulfovibrio sp.]